MNTETTYPPYSFRIPKAGEHDQHFGLTRTAWYNLATPCKANGFHPLVRSVELKEKDKNRGTRVIVYESARKYFEKLEREQHPTD